ncbi:DUF4145 domain-containing protein [Methylobacter sp.]|uniref:DUF4145 domain-containing protein n=1 Tax=Methylobacter sp. TaxID=2051955 RepID=UPI003DA48213
MSEYRRHIGFCPHCGNRTPQRIALVHTYRESWFAEDGTELPDDEGPDCEAIVCICETCSSVLLYDGISQDETGYWPELRYPKGFQLHKSVPASIQGIYKEAALVKRNAPNAFAMLIRKGLEAICDDRGTSNGTLASRLKHLSNAGEIPPALAEVTDALRIVGNTAAHGPLQVITQPMTWAIDDFFRAIIEYVYIAPSKLEEFKKKLAKPGVKNV